MPDSTLARRFREGFGKTVRTFRAPGRVNLIGEHTDYNDGFAMPAAIGFYTSVAIAPRADDKLVVHSENFGETVEFRFRRSAPSDARHWSDYVRGVAAMLQQRGVKLRGANLLVSSDVPLGAGLSSSASLEVAVALALLAQAGATMDLMEIALACQQAEHEFAGTKCGIMDQFISCFAERGHAVMLDCRSLRGTPLPLAEGARIAICNTNVKHELASGEYNRRRASCEAGVAALRRQLPAIKALRDVTPRDLEKYGGELDAVTQRRCRHVVNENARVEEASAALRKDDLARFGSLMAASHASLRDDYEVSCRELDVMVEVAARQPGVYGARMTGGGFGGCTVNLVSNDAVAEFTKNVASEYERATGRAANIYCCEAVGRAGEEQGTQA